MASILNLPDDNIGDIQSFTDPYQAKTNSCICKYLSKGFIKIHRQHVEDTLGYRKQLFSKYVPPYIQNKFLGKNTCPPQMPGQVLLDVKKFMRLKYKIRSHHRILCLKQERILRRKLILKNIARSAAKRANILFNGIIDSESDNEEDDDL
tara:strand:+ start:1077 stop:1526 length:450 start_codon:yes stop_codon:yes gene_type:complete